MKMRNEILSEEEDDCPKEAYCCDKGIDRHENCFLVEDYCAKEKTDSQAVRDCLKAASALSQRTVVFSGRDYLLDESVLLPENTTVIIDNCTVGQADETFNTVFRGDNLVLDPKDPYGYAVNVKPICHIRILGRGKAVLSGCLRNRMMYHPFFQEEQTAVGDFWGWRTHLISLSCCTDFEISGLTVCHTRSWAMSFEMSSHGHIHDLHFDTHVKNGDGIDFRKGCSDMLVENITGFTSDDTVACTALRKPVNGVLSRYLYPNEPLARLFYDSDIRRLDIHDITIRNLAVGGNCHGVICLASGGTRVHHITIENIREEGTEQDRHTALVSVYTGYGTGYTGGDLHHIRLSSVTARHGEKAAVDSNAEVDQCIFSKVSNLGAGPAVDFKYPAGWNRRD